MSFDTWVIYLLAVVAVCMTPGPSILLAMSHSVQHGLKRTGVTALGCITATSTMALLSATGLGALLLASETAFTILKWAGGAYLFYMGAAMWFKQSQALLIEGTPAQSLLPLRKLYIKGVIVSASNPKAMIFFGALFPLFLDPQAPLLPQFSLMLGTFLVFSYGFIMGYAAITAHIAPHLRKERVNKVFNRVTGGLFMGIGVALANSEK